MKAKWYMFGCLSSIVILVLFVVVMVSSIAKLVQMPTAPRIENNSVLHLNLSGMYQEYSPITDMNFRFLPSTTHEIIKKINTAKNDSRIRAILLEPQFVQAGYATLNEIMVALEDFRESGKPIYGYINVASQQDLFLLSVADEVVMNPSASAGFVMTGVGTNVSYYQELLEKLGVNVRIVRAGGYKSAGENFARRTMSPEFRRNLTELFNDRYVQLVGHLATNFETTPESIRYLFERNERYFINQEFSREINIVDELMHFDRFLRRLDVSENQLVKMSRYTIDTPRPHMNRIAVVYMQGEITTRRAQFGEVNITSDQFVRIFDKIEKDNNIKAVVVRINSGGGSAMESEVILSKLTELGLKKPVVVSMGNMAASGGYYIAANANYIFADRYTITGSIGVVSMIPDLRSASSKLGINSERVGHGRFLSTNDIWRMFSPEFERGLQIMTSEVYSEFKGRVSEGRNMSLEAVEAVAQGKVWSAQRALEIGLIDRVGTLNDAVAKAAELASIQNFSRVYFPEQRSMFELLMEDSFNFPLSRMLLRRELPSSLVRPVDGLMNLLEDVVTHPVQMRVEMVFED